MKTEKEKKSKKKNIDEIKKVCTIDFYSNRVFNMAGVKKIIWIAEF